ncbi:MAG: pilus assembly protein TadG-related protein, partial [Planctomycetia bacterium]|nr:pilus assembly protein TadG-related protein [Planctomycetia bacterium]
MFRELPSRWARGIARFLARDEEGQAIFLVVGFFLLLAGLLFLIVNTGDQLNTKVEMQNAADAATATGSAWYARGLNAISMSNATEAQIMSFIVVLDTLEEVIPHAVQTIDDLVANLGQTPAGRDMPIYEPIAWLTVGEARAEQDIVHKLADIVQGIPLEEYFSYDDGVLWQACKLLDAFAEEMAEITPLLCQEQTILAAQDNNAEFGTLSPLWPVLPVRDGVFEDFRNPMVSAQMPPPLNSRIGGFTQLFGYGTGPYSHFRDPFINCKPMGLFDLSRLSPMFRIVSSMKFEMLFGSEDDMLCLGKWEMDYDKAVEIARLEAEARSAGLEPEVTILRTWWEHVGFDSREEFPTSLFYQSIDLRSPKNPQPSLQSNDGWRAAPANHTRSTTAMEGADSRHAIFYRSTERRTVNYTALGIIPPH